MLNQKAVVEQSEDILGGALVFAGTRVPVHTLVDYLTGGDTIDEFLDDFPSVSREQDYSSVANHRASFDVIVNNRHDRKCWGEVMNFTPRLINCSSYQRLLMLPFCANPHTISKH